MGSVKATQYEINVDDKHTRTVPSTASFPLQPLFLQMFSQTIGATSSVEESVQIRHKIFHEKVQDVAPSDKLIGHK
jgi:hypothetical protein